MGFVPANHPLSKKKKVYLEELAEAPFVNLQGSRAERMLKELQKRGIRLKIAMNCDTAEAVKTAVQKGIGISMLFCDRMKAEMTAGHVKAIKIADLPIRIDSFIVLNKKKNLSPNALAFLDLMRKQRQGGRES